MKYEHFEHEADIGIRGFGNEIEEAFENCAKAMFQVTHNMQKVENKKSVHLECDSEAQDELLIELLNELISLSEIENMTFKEVKVKIWQDDKFYLTGKAYGEKRDIPKHEFKTEVKAATFSNLKVELKDGKWTAQCVVDV